MASPEPDEDPWHWTVDQVIEVLSNRHTSWYGSRTGDARPGSGFLATSLREHSINGCVLLADIDDAAIQEMGIKPLGHRLTLRRAIRTLQDRSPTFQSMILKTAAQTPLPDAGAVLTPARTMRSPVALEQNHTAGPAPFVSDDTGTKRRRLAPTLVRTFDDARVGIVPEVALGENVHQRPFPDLEQTLDSDRMDIDATTRMDHDEDHLAVQPGVERAEELFESQLQNEKASQVGQPLEDDKPLGLDSAGRDGHDAGPERQSHSFIQANDVKAERNETDHAESMSPTGGGVPTVRCNDATSNEAVDQASVLTENVGRKRLIPTKIADPRFTTLSGDQTQATPENLSVQDPPSPTQIEPTSISLHKDSNSGSTPRWHYYGKRPLPLDDIFYGLPPAVGNSEDFVHDGTSGPRVPPGVARYVGGRLKYLFYSTKPRVFLKDGRRFAGLQPYPSHLVHKLKDPCFTLFDTNNGVDNLPTKEDLASWPQFESLTETPLSHRASGSEDVANFHIPKNNPFDLLEDMDEESLDYLYKYKYAEDGDRTLPVFGESGSENEMDDATWREYEQEQRRNGKPPKRPLRLSRRKQLSQEEILEAIEHGVQDLVNFWQEKILPNHQLQAWNVWQRAKRTRSRFSGIYKAKQRIAHLNKERLPKLKAEIAKQDWTSTLQVRKSCGNMQESIFEREFSAWIISILEKKTEPARPPPTLPRPKIVRKPKEEGRVDGEESQQSTSEGELVSTDDYDDVDDFIVDVDPAGEEITCGEFQSADEGDVSMSEADEESEDEEDIIPAGPRRATPVAQSSEGVQDNSGDAVIIVSSPPSADDEMPKEQQDLKKSSSPWTKRKIDARNHESANSSNVHTPQRQPEPSNVVDLTISSDTAEEFIKTPPVNEPTNENPYRSNSKTRPKDNLVRPKGDTSTISRKDDFVGASQSGVPNGVGEKTVQDEDLGAYNDIAAVARHPFPVFEVARDQRRLLMKVLSNLQNQDLEHIMARVTTTDYETLRKDVFSMLRLMKDDKKATAGMDAEAFTHLRHFSRLFCCWFECKYRIPSEAVPAKSLTKILKDLGAFKLFYKDLCNALENYDSSDDELPDKDENPKLSSIEIVKTRHDLRKARKKRVNRNMGAKKTRADDRQRMLEQEARRQKLIRSGQLSSNGLGGTGSASLHLINIGREDDQAFVRLNARLSRDIKPHQLEGVRFLWRELVTDKAQQGCLLAHTMGLGKTMQCISLLVTVDETAKSSDPQMFLQLPEHLRKSRTLVLCPPSLIENWYDEILIWTLDPVEDNIGPIFKLDSSLTTLEERLARIADWYDRGGLLIISYDIFRGLVLNKAAKNRLPRLDETQHTIVREHLLEGPNIIIADEAHKMKNPQTGIAIAAAQFKSKSRIALTGSPLANNLEEYYSMINWVAPKYLGALTEFRAHYKEPIEEGLYADSTRGEQRMSQVKLHVLKKDLEPKVNRADISVLKGSLKPKIEFVIKVPLTKLQRDAYRLYAQLMLSGAGDHVSNARLWDLLATVGLLCNHPLCFRNKLLEREETALLSQQKTERSNVQSQKDKGSLGQVDDEKPEYAPGDAHVSKIGLSPKMIQQLLAFLEEYKDNLAAIEHSHKAQLFDQILDAAIEAGDKTLVFSHTIPTLDYLEGLFKKSKRRYARLDGKSKMSQRQNATKNFNTNDCDVLLVSTRAGGLGLNLPGANRVIVFDFNFNPTWEEQAVGRAYRIGQTKPVFVYHITVGGTFEDVVHNKAIFKQQLASRVVDKRNPTRFAERKLRDYLFEPKILPQTDLSALQGKDPKVLDLVLASQKQNRTICSIDLTETFHRDDNDHLTLEEEREAAEIMKDNNLKRSDPLAYSKLLRDRQDAQLRRASQNHNSLTSTSPVGFGASPLYQTGSAPTQVNVPSNIANQAPGSRPPNPPIPNKPPSPVAPFPPNLPPKETQSILPVHSNGAPPMASSPQATISAKPNSLPIVSSTTKIADSSPSPPSESEAAPGPGSKAVGSLSPPAAQLLEALRMFKGPPKAIPGSGQKYAAVGSKEKVVESGNQFLTLSEDLIASSSGSVNSSKVSIDVQKKATTSLNETVKLSIERLIEDDSYTLPLDTTIKTQAVEFTLGLSRHVLDSAAGDEEYRTRMDDVVGRLTKQPSVVKDLLRGNGTIALFLVAEPQEVLDRSVLQDGAETVGAQSSDTARPVEDAHKVRKSDVSMTPPHHSQSSSGPGSLLSRLRDRFHRGSLN
ncbi:MAG: hypothetical protein M1833_000085 [Piccolia ochrophora]|nr:MAG: hypothetical protein M1833_000085 [Piccolia ochrophora]